MKVTTLLVALCLYSVTSLCQSDTLIDQEGVSVTYEKTHCDLKMGYDQEWVILTFKNTNPYRVTLIWDLEMWIDGECKTCNDPQGEYHRVLELKPGEVITGKCGVKEDNRLYIFSKFNDPNTDMDYELTDFDLANFMVVNMTKTR